MTSKKIIVVFCILCLLSTMLFACNITEKSNEASNNSTSGTDIEEKAVEEMFTTADNNDVYDEASVSEITLSNSNSTTTSSNVSINGDVITISGDGDYLIKGELSNGYIVVDSSDNKLRLIFNGVSITSESSAGLYIKDADKVFVTLAEGSENYISTTSDFIAIDDNSIDGAIFSKEDITFNGSGKLTIKCEKGHGIVSKDDLVITGGDYAITAKKHAIVGKDCVKIADGKFTLNAEKDGIHSENSDDSTLGYIYIATGEFTIDSDGDGIDANSYLQILEGTYNIDSVGKGIKSTGEMLLKNGVFTIMSTDDSVHSNSNLNISGGTFNISSEDDGVHADNNLKITDGTITISKSYEGLEGLSIDIQGGNITIAASDDGLNAAGGADSSGFGGIFGGDRFSSSSSSSYIKISGGKININSTGDGVDSNGALYISGGECYVSGPTDSANAALDFDGTGSITGGIVIATGSSGMAQNFGSNSTQGSILLTFSSYSSSKVNICDSSANELASFSPNKQYNCVLVSTPLLEKGKTYTLTAAGKDTSITLSSLIYSSSNGQTGGGSFPGGRW